MAGSGSGAAPAAEAGTHGDPAPRRRRTPGELVAMLVAAGEKYGRDRCPQHAAAVSYHVLFALVPLFIFVASALGVVLRDDDLRGDFVDAVLARFPLTEEAGVDIDEILASVPAPAGVAGLVGLVALFWSASSMTGSLRVALTAAFSDGTERPYFQSKLVDLALVVAVAMLLLASFGLSVVVHAVQRWSTRVAAELGALELHEWSLLATVGPAVLAFVAFAVLYRLVPPTRPKLRDVWAGALLAAVGFAAVNVGFSYYLTTVATWDVLYGSLGSLLAFLLVVYLEVAVFLFGAELAAVWSRPPPAEPGPGVPLRRQIVLGLRGLFVRDRSPG